MNRKQASVKIMAVLTASLVIAATAVPVLADDPVSIVAQSGESKTVSADGISSDECVYAAETTANSGGQAEINVNGDITLQPSDGAQGVTPMGVKVQAFDEGSSSSVNVSGSVDIEAENTMTMGIYALGVSGGESAAAVEGDIDIVSDSGYAVQALADYENSNTTVEVGGNAVIESSNGATGVIAQAAHDGNTEVVIGGNVETTSEANGGTALMAAIMESGNVSIQVGGDAAGSDTGLLVYGFGGVESGTVDVVIEGTLTGKESPVFLAEEVEGIDVNLTAWKIVPNADGKIVTYNEGNDLAKYAADLEAGILYIIKVEQPGSGGSVSLGGVSDSHGFDTAKEGDTVTLKASLQNGYKVAGAYNNGTALTLKDADGNYYIVVPKGGGVSLSVLLEKIAEDAASEPSAPAAVTTAAETVTEKQLIDEFAFTAADSEAKVSFYDDSTFVIALPDGSEIGGTFAFVDGRLTFNGIELDVTIDEEDGSYHCIYTTEAGEVIEFVLEAEFVEKLKAAVEG